MIGQGPAPAPDGLRRLLEAAACALSPQGIKDDPRRFDPSAPRRWYCAWHPDVAEGIVRQKNAVGLAEWYARDWEIFPGPPLIVDVTHSMPKLLDWMASSRKALLGIYLGLYRVVLVVREAGPDLFMNPSRSQPLEGEVADVTHALGIEVVSLSPAEQFFPAES